MPEIFSEKLKFISSQEELRKQFPEKPFFIWIEIHSSC